MKRQWVSTVLPFWSLAVTLPPPHAIAGVDAGASANPMSVSAIVIDRIMVAFSVCLRVDSHIVLEEMAPVGQGWSEAWNNEQPNQKRKTASRRSLRNPIKCFIRQQFANNIRRVGPHLCAGSSLSATGGHVIKTLRPASSSIIWPARPRLLCVHPL